MNAVAAGTVVSIALEIHDAQGVSLQGDTLDYLHGGYGALPVALERARQPVADAQALVPYFWRKRSTRPAVSISFCLPV